MTSQNIAALTLSNALAVAQASTRVHRAQVRRHLGMIHSIELFEELALDVGYELDHVATIELDDDGEAVLLDRAGLTVDGFADGLPSARDAVLSVRALDQWIPELSS